MEELLLNEFYGNSLKTWCVALIYIASAIFLSRILLWFTKVIVRRITSKTKMRLDDILIDMLEEPIALAIVIGGFRAGVAQLTFSAGIESVIGKIFIVAATINATWLISRVIIALVDEYVQPRIKQAENDSSNQIYPIIRKCIKSVIWLFGLVTALNNSGYDVGALIAGLGIGGLALAMAAQNTVSNFFGGITILVDKSFSIGQRIRISGYDGFVESIGLRSFRLRTLSGTLVTIPNSLITGSIVENVSIEPTRKITLNLGLVYDTTPDQMEQAMSLLKEIVIENDHVTDAPLIFFDSYGDFALGITFIYYIKKEANICTTQSEINLAVLRKFNGAGLSFAFPTQTLYVEKNGDKPVC